MANVQEKIKELEETLAKSKYNKHTQKAHGMMYAGAFCLNFCVLIRENAPPKISVVSLREGSDA